MSYANPEQPIDPPDDSLSDAEMRECERAARDGFGAMDEQTSWMDAAFAAEKARCKRAEARLKDIRALEAKINEGVARFGGNVYCADCGGGYRVLWKLLIDDFREAAPLIEYIEAFAGECSSRDWPEYRERDFEFPLIDLSCKINSDAEACRVVITGYKAREPIFAFECAEGRP